MQAASHNPPIIQNFQDLSKKFHQLRSRSVTSSLSDDPKPKKIRIIFNKYFYQRKFSKNTNFWIYRNTINRKLLKSLKNQKRK